MQPERKWILLVDDDDEVRELITYYIEINYSHSVKIIEASDGVEASHKINFQAFDVIVTDLELPGRGGHAFIKAAEQSQMNDTCPIIIITGNPDPAIEKKYSHIKQISKPFEMSALLTEITRQLKLGKTNQRMTAGVLNCYIDGAKNFVEKIIGESPTQSLTTLKKTGYFNNNQEHIRLTFKVGNHHNTFIIGFDREIVEKIRESLNSDIVLEDHLICTTAAKTIFRRASSKLWKEYNERPLLVDCSYLDTNNNSNDSSYLSNSVGILIPLESSYGEMKTIAIWENSSLKSGATLKKNSLKSSA